MKELEKENADLTSELAEKDLAYASALAEKEQYIKELERKLSTLQS